MRFKGSEDGGQNGRVPLRIRHDDVHALRDRHLLHLDVAAHQVYEADVAEEVSQVGANAIHHTFRHESSTLPAGVLLLLVSLHAPHHLLPRMLLANGRSLQKVLLYADSDVDYDAHPASRILSKQRWQNGER